MPPLLPPWSRSEAEKPTVKSAVMFSRASDEWTTPLNVFARLHDEFHELAVSPARDR
jgi:hypothetical protein